jgi:hypothetical protein
MMPVMPSRRSAGDLEHQAVLAWQKMSDSRRSSSTDLLSIEQNLNERWIWPRYVLYDDRDIRLFLNIDVGRRIHDAVSVERARWCAPFGRT